MRLLTAFFFLATCSVLCAAPPEGWPSSLSVEVFDVPGDWAGSIGWSDGWGAFVSEDFGTAWGVYVAPIGDMAAEVLVSEGATEYLRTSGFFGVGFSSFSGVIWPVGGPENVGSIGVVPEPASFFLLSSVACCLLLSRGSRSFWASVQP